MYNLTENCVVCGSPKVKIFQTEYGTSILCERCHTILGYDWMIQLRNKLQQLQEYKRREQEMLKRSFIEHQKKQSLQRRLPDSIAPNRRKSERRAPVYTLPK